jgi:hypothetical protein
LPLPPIHTSARPGGGGQYRAPCSAWCGRRAGARHAHARADARWRTMLRPVSGRAGVRRDCAAWCGRANWAGACILADLPRLPAGRASARLGQALERPARGGLRNLCFRGATAKWSWKRAVAFSRPAATRPAGSCRAPVRASTPYTRNGTLASMPVNHYWHTNFPTSQCGALCLRYRFVLPLADTEQGVQTALPLDALGWR